MTKIAEFYCDYCNASRQQRHEGDEVSTGYAAELGDDHPMGWWDVPGLGPSGTTGHACPECVLHNEEAKVDIAKRRGEMSSRILGLEIADDEDGPGVESPGSEGGWPSIASPFGGPGDGGDGPDR